MRLFALFAASLLALPLVSDAGVVERERGESAAQRAQAHAEGISDAGAFLKEVDSTVEMARAGEYGRLHKGTLVRIEMARDRMNDLLEGHDSALELAPEERLELYNAQEMITSAIRNDDKNRTVCKREMITGSRLPKTECMTVAEREARRRAAAENTDKFIRNLCTPGAESSPCVQ
jgi:hypothetical protein